MLKDSQRFLLFGEHLQWVSRLLTLHIHVHVHVHALLYFYGKAYECAGNTYLGPDFNQNVEGYDFDSSMPKGWDVNARLEVQLHCLRISLLLD